MQESNNKEYVDFNEVYDLMWDHNPSSESYGMILRYDHETGMALPIGHWL